MNRYGPLHPQKTRYRPIAAAILPFCLYFLPGASTAATVVWTVFSCSVVFVVSP